MAARIQIHIPAPLDRLGTATRRDSDSITRAGPGVSQGMPGPVFLKALASSGPRPELLGDTQTAEDDVAVCRHHSAPNVDRQRLALPRP